MAERQQLREADPCKMCGKAEGDVKNVEDWLCGACVQNRDAWLKMGGTEENWRKHREEFLSVRTGKRTQAMSKDQDKLLGIYSKLMHLLNQLRCTPEQKKKMIAVIEKERLAPIRHEIPMQYRSISDDQWVAILQESLLNAHQGRRGQIAQAVPDGGGAADANGGPAASDGDDEEGEGDDSVGVPKDAVAPPELPEEESKPEAAEKTQAPQPPKLRDAVKKKDVVPPAPFIPETPPHPEPKLAKVSPEAAAAMQQAAENEPDSKESELREILGKALEPGEVEDAIAATRGLKWEERKQKLVELLKKRMQEVNEKYNAEVRRLEAEKEERIKSLEAEIEQAKSRDGKPRQPKPKAYGPYAEKVVNAFAARSEEWLYTENVAVASGVRVSTLRKYLNEFHSAGLLERWPGQWGQWKLIPDYKNHAIYLRFFPKTGEKSEKSAAADAPEPRVEAITADADVKRAERERPSAFLDAEFGDKAPQPPLVEMEAAPKDLAAHSAGSLKYAERAAEEEAK